MNYKEIDINDLYISELNVRKNIKEEYIIDLSKNIKENGLLNPLTVQFNNKNKKYEIIAGQCRYKALQKLELYKKIPCNLLNKTRDELQIISLIENIKRINMKLSDKVRAYKKIYDSFGKELKDEKEQIIKTVKYTGTKKATVDKYIKINDLSDKILNRLDSTDDNKITLDLACRLVELKNNNIYISDNDIINILDEISFTTNENKINILKKFNISNSTGSMKLKIIK